MSTPTVSPLRQRMIEDMNARRACRTLREVRAHRIAYNSCRNRHCPKWSRQR